MAGLEPAKPLRRLVYSQLQLPLCDTSIDYNSYPTLRRVSSPYAGMLSLASLYCILCAINTIKSYATQRHPTFVKVVLSNISLHQ